MTDESPLHSRTKNYVLIETSNVLVWNLAEIDIRSTESTSTEKKTYIGYC